MTNDFLKKSKIKGTSTAMKRAIATKTKRTIRVAFMAIVFSKGKGSRPIESPHPKNMGLSGFPKDNWLMQ